MHTCFFNMYGIHGFLDTDLRRGMFNCLVLDTSKVSTQPFRYIQITEVVDGLLHHQQAEKLDDAKRILCAPSVWLWMKKLVESFGSDVAIGRSSTTVVIKHGASEISHKYHKWMGKSSMVEFFGVLCAEFFWVFGLLLRSFHQTTSTT